MQDNTVLLLKGYNQRTKSGTFARHTKLTHKSKPLAADPTTLSRKYTPKKYLHIPPVLPANRVKRIGNLPQRTILNRFH